jgi:Mucin-2 protein WxxW repeating region
LDFKPRETTTYWEDIAMQIKYFWQVTRKVWLLVAIGAICLIGPAQTARAQGAVCPPGGDCPCTWSAWLDRDDPTGVGDFEDLTSLIKEKKATCARPTAVQCRYKGGQVWGSQTLPLGPVNTAGAGYTCLVSGSSAGAICVNAKTKPPGTESKPTCKDSEVRFCCAKD